MPAGLPYFAWIDATETTFEPEHMRWDESVFSFTCEQSEGDPANLTVVVRRPRNVGGDPDDVLTILAKVTTWNTSRDEWAAEIAWQLEAEQRTV